MLGSLEEEEETPEHPSHSHQCTEDSPHSLPNDSYMCRDGSTAEGSLGHRGWGLPRAQSGTKAGGRPAWLILGDPSLPKLSPAFWK